MKRETYFTPENIVARSNAMLDALASFRSRHADILFDRERAALLVLDMQNYFLREESHAYIPSAGAVLPNILGLIDSFCHAGRPVIFTRHIDDETGMLPRWWQDTIRAVSSESAIISALDTARGLVIDKSQYDAFYRTSLEENLKGRGVEQVVISGVMTHLCCETTARSAFVRGFEVFFCIDGTATYSGEVHLASIKNLSHGFAIPVRAEEIV